MPTRPIGPRRAVLRPPRHTVTAGTMPRPEYEANTGGKEELLLNRQTNKTRTNKTKPNFLREKQTKFTDISKPTAQKGKMKMGSKQTMQNS